MTAAVGDDDEYWRSAPSHWGVARVPAKVADVVLHSGTGRSTPDTSAPQILVRGAVLGGRLRRKGYTVTTYRVRWLSGHVVVAAPDSRGFRLARDVWGPARGRGLRALAAGMLRPRPITVASRGQGSLPAALAESGLRRGRSGRAFCLAVDVRDRRRRAVFLSSDDDGRPTVLKISRLPGVEARGVQEQRVLALLPRGDVTPRPLGAGRAGPVEWSAETVVRGRPLNELRSRPGTPVERVLERLGSWLGEVAVATAGPLDWAAAADGDRVVSLRGTAIGLRPLLSELQAVPAVLTHGDLASGHNVLVDRAYQPSVLDWETARVQGLPLLDLVPVLCMTLARARVGYDARSQAAHVLAMASGRDSASGWLFARVSEYATRLDLPLDATGRLALLSWGHQASMRLVRDELLVAAGQRDLRPWTSAGELVLERWWDEIGVEWPAFRAWTDSRRGEDQ